MPAALNVELEQLVERLAARCRHASEPCQACTNNAVIAVETFLESGWYAQLRRYRAATTRSASISAPIPLPTSTDSPTPRHAA